MTDLDAAVARLGARTIGHLTLSGEIFGIDRARRSELPLDIELLQSHSLAVARLASRLVEEGGSRDDAFASGLLHEVGRLMLAVRLPEEFKQIEALVEGGEILRAEAERQVLGFQQGELGAYLFGLWGLPDVVAESTRSFAVLDLAPSDPVTVPRAVAIADTLVADNGTLRGDTSAALDRFASDPRHAAWIDRARDLLCAGDARGGAR
jgi:HD-like signal output (HDOD) protein